MAKVSHLGSWVISVASVLLAIGSKIMNFMCVYLLVKLLSLALPGVFKLRLVEYKSGT